VSVGILDPDAIIRGCTGRVGPHDAITGDHPDITKRTPACQHAIRMWDRERRTFDIPSTDDQLAVRNILCGWQLPTL
jgi:hypothetical protein